MKTAEAENRAEGVTSGIPSPSENADSTLERVFAGFRGEKAELIPILQQVQNSLGYLPEEALKRIAHFTRVPEANVFGVATFYSQFRLTPVGRNIIKVCRGTGCYVKGAPRLLDEVEKLLAIKDGETTEDLEYTLETVACFGSCALAPVVVINDDVYGLVTIDKLRALLQPDGAAGGETATEAGDEAGDE